MLWGGLQAADREGLVQVRQHSFPQAVRSEPEAAFARRLRGWFRIKVRLTVSIPAGVSRHRAARRCQEFGGREGIEIKHLSASELPIANLVKPQNGSVKPPAGLVAAALMPQHHHLILGACSQFDAAASAAVAARMFSARVHYSCRARVQQPSAGSVARDRWICRPAACARAACCSSW